MKNTKFFFILATIGILFGLISVYIYSAKGKSFPPRAISYNPYTTGIYASGIIESYQNNGENINIYPEVAGKVTKIFVTDGQTVKQGAPLLAIDDAVQKEIVAKDAAQAQAALATLEQLRATPRKEDLDVITAQVNYAQATLKNAQDQLAKIRKAYALNSKSISQNSLDNAINAEKIAAGNFKVVAAQYALIKAGTWNFQIKSQEEQYKALFQTYKSDAALLDRYVIKAPVDGVILRLTAAVGGYASTQGIYETYTQNMMPIVTMGVVEPYLGVRCYVDELLIAKLPQPQAIEAKLLVRGENNRSIPLEFVRLQPYTIPNIELSYQKATRVDVRVLPLIFKFQRPTDINLYPGQLVDVYIKGKEMSKDKENKIGGKIGAWLLNKMEKRN